MQFIDIPIEQTTAITDVILGVVAVVVSYSVYKSGRSRHPGKAKTWATAFSLLAVASFFGAAAHGFKMTGNLNFILWQPINFALGITIALFVIGVFHDLRGNALNVLSKFAILGTGVVFYLVTLFIPGSFFVFILYEAIAMVFALIAYLYLSFSRKQTGKWWMVAGILVTIIAAGIQATGAIHFTVIWQFDHNGVFHLVQIFGLLFLHRGLTLSFIHR